MRWRVWQSGKVLWKLPGDRLTALPGSANICLFRESQRGRMSTSCVLLPMYLNTIKLRKNRYWLSRNTPAKASTSRIPFAGGWGFSRCVVENLVNLIKLRYALLQDELLTWSSQTWVLLFLPALPRGTWSLPPQPPSYNPNCIYPARGNYYSVLITLQTRKM